MKICALKVDRKLKPQLKRKLSRKDDFDDESRSPVSGTVIKKLAEGEPVPEIKKGEEKKEKNISKTFHQVILILSTMLWKSQKKLKKNWRRLKTELETTFAGLC